MVMMIIMISVMMSIVMILMIMQRMRVVDGAGRDVDSVEKIALTLLMLADCGGSHNHDHAHDYIFDYDEDGDDNEGMMTLVIELKRAKSRRLEHDWNSVVDIKAPN